MAGSNTFKRILGYFSKAKAEECDHKDRNLFKEFRMLMAGSDTYFVEVKVL